MSCPPKVPDPCAQVCPPPPPPPPCLVKPIMRNMHWTQTKRILAEAFILITVVGLSIHFFVNKPKIARYKDFYAKAELDDWADEMARKGLFQSVPTESLKDNQHMKKK